MNHGLLLGLMNPEYMLIIILVLFLLFGRKLPEIGRSLGKGIVEFKKGLSGIEDDLNANADPNRRPNQQVTQQEPPRPPTPVLPRSPEFKETTNQN